MRILWDKKLIRLSDGSYIAWGIKRKKFFFANKNELKLNCAIIEYYKEREKCDKKVISDLNKIIAELKRDKPELCNAINEEGKAWIKLNEKLSKAKGLIEKLLIVSCNSEILIQYPNCKEVLEARVALEQFLKEIKE